MRALLITEKTRKELTAKQLMELKTLINYLDIKIDIDDLLKEVKLFYFIEYGNINKIISCCAISKKDELMLVRTHSGYLKKGYSKLLIQYVLMNHPELTSYTNNPTMIKMLTNFGFVTIDSIVSKLTNNVVSRLMKVK